MDKKQKQQLYSIIYLESLLFGRCVRDTFSQEKTDKIYTDEMLHALRFLILQDRYGNFFDEQTKEELREAFYILSPGFRERKMIDHHRCNNMLRSLNVADTRNVERFISVDMQLRMGENPFAEKSVTALASEEKLEEYTDFVHSSYIYDFKLTEALYQKEESVFLEQLEYLALEPNFCLGYLRKVVAGYSKFLEDPLFARRLIKLAHCVSKFYKTVEFGRWHVEDIRLSAHGKLLEFQLKKIVRGKNE